MKKIILFGISIAFFIGIVYFFVKNNRNKTAEFNKNITISCFDYDTERDFSSIERIINENTFWLFHGDPELGKKSVYLSFESKTHQDDFEHDLSVPYFVKIAQIDGQTIGFISYFGSEKNKIGRIHLLCVDQKYRQFGVGNQLVQEAINYFKLSKKYNRIFLYTRPENARSKSLYKKFGFYELQEETGLDHLYDENPGDVLVLDI